MDDRKIIGITMGDPASIGPEITVKALADKAVYDECRPIVVGDACVLKAALKIVGHEELTVRAVKDVKDAVPTHGTIDVLDMELVSWMDWCGDRYPPCAGTPRSGMWRR